MDECNDIGIAKNLLCPTAASPTCVSSETDFGKFSCACDTVHFTGAHCDIECGAWYRDADGDGFVSEGFLYPKQCSQPAADATRTTLGNERADCDGNSNIRPNATELCDGVVDNNCDGQVDETFKSGPLALGTPCDNGLLGACRRTGVRVCSQNGLTTEGRADTATVSQDTNCNGSSTDLVYPTSGTLEGKQRAYYWKGGYNDNKDHKSLFNSYEFSSLCSAAAESGPYGVIASSDEERCRTTYRRYYPGPIYIIPRVHYFSETAATRRSCTARLHRISCSWDASLITAFRSNACVGPDEKGLVYKGKGTGSNDRDHNVWFVPKENWDAYIGVYNTLEEVVEQRCE
jgi:hypothetical protein